MRAIGLAVVMIAAAPDGEAARRAFDPARDPRFADAAPAIRRYLMSAVPRPGGPQHFCVIGYRVGGERLAWVHWREGHALLLWRGGDRSAADDSLVLSNRQLDLDADVVADTAAVGGSTYRVTRAWVDRTLADCRRLGRRYAIIAPPRRIEGGE